MSKKLYLFDCFGVVLNEVSTLCMQGKFTAEQQRFMREQVFRRVDTGEAEMEYIFTTVADKFGYDKEQFRREWKSYEDVNCGTVKLIDELRAQGGRVGLLSNANAGYIDYLFNRFDLYRRFDKVFVSSSFRVAKPDIAFYKLCLDGFGEKFDEIYFTDDNPQNLVGLEALGITPILFTSAEQLRKRLISQ